MTSLQALSADQQVALLFVTLFGLLGLVTTGASLDALRERNSAQDERHLRLQRELRAVWVGAVVFWAAWISGPAGATTLFGVISFMALREYVTLLKTRRSDHRSLLLAFFGVPSGKITSESPLRSASSNGSSGS